MRQLIKQAKIQAPDISGSRRLGVPVKTHKNSDLDTEKTRQNVNTDLSDTINTVASFSEEITEPSVQDQPAGPSQEELKEIFSEELEQLKEEVRVETIDKLQQEADDYIEESLKKEKAELKADFEKDIEKLQSAVASIESIKQQYEDELQSVITQIESHAVKISLECLYKLAGDKDIYQAIIEKTIQDVFEQNAINTQVKIKISEQDAEVINTISETDLKSCRIVKDKLASPGTCIIESGLSRTDLCVLTQVDQIRDAVLNTLNDTKK